MSERTATSPILPEPSTAGGDHDLTSYVTVFLALHEGRRTGVLETGNRRGWRKLFFLDGEVVGFASSFSQEEPGRALAASGVVPRARIQWFEDRLDPGEPIEAALLASGAISAEQLAEHEVGRLRQGILAPLRANTGTWSFTPCPGLRPERVAAVLRPEIRGVRELWEGVRQHVPVDKVLPEVSDATLGPLVAGPGLAGFLALLDLEPPLAFLGEAVGDGIAVEDLVRQMPDRSGNLLKLVWMLERGGRLLRRGGVRDERIAESVERACAAAGLPKVEAGRLAAARAAWDAPPSATPRSPSVEPAFPASVDGGPRSAASEPISEPPTVPPDRDALSDPGHPRASSRDAGSSFAADRAGSRTRGGAMDAEQLSADHARRMERDFYGFLGLKQGCPLPVVVRRCEHMASRWEALEEAGLDETARRQRRELLQGVQIVLQTLGVHERKEEYDRRMREGKAARVEDVRRALERPGPERSATMGSTEEPGPADLQAGLVQAQRLMARGSWGAAARILERLRRDNPSSPDVLADLGWAVWRERGKPAPGDEDPEDFVALALTFAPRHPRALEHFARIASERGDQEALHDRLDRLLAVDKGNAWALEVLAGDSSAAPSGRKASGSGLRFWRRRSDG